MASNRAAYLDSKSATLRLESAPMPSPGPNEIVIANRAIAMNPIVNFQRAVGARVKSWPYVLGSDVAGEVHEVGSGVTKFRQGDRVVGHSRGLLTGEEAGGAFQQSTKLPAANAAVVPDQIPFKDAAVLPMAIDTGTAALFQDEEGGLRLPWPTLSPKPTGKTIVVYGASSSVGSMAVQLATAAGVRVIAIASARNHELCRKCGASEALDYKKDSLVEDVVNAVGEDDFVGVFRPISTAETFKCDLAILERLGGGSLAATHKVPEALPSNVKARYVFGLGDFSFPVWEDFVAPALASGQLKCLPSPLVVGKGSREPGASVGQAEGWCVRANSCG